MGFVIERIGCTQRRSPTIILKVEEIMSALLGMKGLAFLNIGESSFYTDAREEIGASKHYRGIFYDSVASPGRKNEQTCEVH
jgi:hypothetical protein